MYEGTCIFYTVPFRHTCTSHLYFQMDFQMPHLLVRLSTTYSIGIFRRRRFADPVLPSATFTTASPRQISIVVVPCPPGFCWRDHRQRGACGRQIQLIKMHVRIGFVFPIHKFRDVLFQIFGFGIGFRQNVSGLFSSSIFLGSADVVQCCCGIIRPINSLDRLRFNDLAQGCSQYTGTAAGTIVVQTRQWHPHDHGLATADHHLVLEPSIMFFFPLVAICFLRRAMHD